MEEIQNNPNIPDDIKAVLSGSVLDEAEPIEEPTDAVCVKDSGVEAMILEKYDDLYEDSDEEVIRKRRGRKSKKEDDDWFATTKERIARDKMVNGPRPRGRPKRKSDEGPVDKLNKRKKPTPKKKDDSLRKSTENSKPNNEKNKVAKKPPALPFNLDLSKKFEGKIPSLKNNSINPTSNAELPKKSPDESINTKICIDKGKQDKCHNVTDTITQTGNSSMSTATYTNPTIIKQTSVQNGAILEPSNSRTSKYSLMV